MGSWNGPDTDVCLRFFSAVYNDYPITGTYRVAFDNLEIKGWDGVDVDGYAYRPKYGGWHNSIDFSLSPIGKWGKPFNGSSNYMRIANHEDWNHQDLTVEVWFKANSLHDGRLIGRHVEPTNASFILELTTAGALNAKVRDSDGNQVRVERGSYSANTWHYAAMTYSAADKKLRLFLDGTQVGADINSSVTNSFASTLGLDVGADRSGDATDYFNGDIGAIRISKVARTPLEIFNYYNGADVRSE
jgi:hypothetical protein